MTQPYDSCRLFFAMRNKAWANPESPADERGVVDLDGDFDGPEDVGLTRAEAEAALASLLEADLVHSVTEQEERWLGLEHHEGGSRRLFVQPMDDLLAATILLTLA